MNDPTSGHEARVGAAGRPRSRQYALLGAICALVIGVYAWCAESGFLELWGSKAENNYYNPLVQGFRSGQLNLKRDVPPSLKQLSGSPNPAGDNASESDPSGLLDLSYYEGKLYFYFGVTPALMIFWPYVALTGHYLLHKDAVAIFYSIGFLASVGLLWAVWRRYFAKVSVAVVAACGVAVGWASFLLVCLPCAGVYEVAISCGYALAMVTLLLLWRAMHTTRARIWWLAGASLAYGLAVGARPSLLLGTILLLVPVVMGWQDRSETGQRRMFRTLFLAAAGPITFIGVGLMLFNYLRFDNPFEFGQHYMLSWAGQRYVQSQYRVQLFSPRFLWMNFQIYFLEPACWSSRLPFVHDIAAPVLPPGHTGITHVFGVLPNLPLVWLALAAPLGWRGLSGPPRGALRWFGLMLILLSGSCALTICLFSCACFRYQVDFLPALVVLAAVGILGVERTLGGRAGFGAGIRWGWGLLLVISVLFNWLVMYGLLSEFHVYNGFISFRKGRLEEATVQFQKALKLQPDNAEAHSNLGEVFYRQGKVTEGIWHQEEALRLKPQSFDILNNLALALWEQGKVAEGVEPVAQAMHLKPGDADAREELGLELARQGRAAAAALLFSDVVRLRPDPTAHCNLALALVMQGNGEAAVEHYRETLRLKPDWLDALNNLAWILATHPKAAVRDGGEAIRLAQRACDLSARKEARFLCTLDAAYAEAGRFEEAIATAKEARDLATATGQKELADQAEGRLKLYESGRPYREGPAPER